MHLTNIQTLRTNNIKNKNEAKTQYIRFSSTSDSFTKTKTKEVNRINKFYSSLLNFFKNKKQISFGSKTTKSEHKKHTTLGKSYMRDFVERYKNGETLESIAKDYNCSSATVCIAINSQENIDEIKAEHKKNSAMFRKDQTKGLIERYKSGETLESIAKDYNCSRSTIRATINSQDNADEIGTERKKSIAMFSEDQIKDIIGRYKRGETLESIAKDYNCNRTTIGATINSQENVDEIKKEHKKHEEQEKGILDIIDSYRKGESETNLAQRYHCSRQNISQKINRYPDAVEIKAEHKKYSKLN